MGQGLYRHTYRLCLPGDGEREPREIQFEADERYTALTLFKDFSKQATPSAFRGRPQAGGNSILQWLLADRLASLQARTASFGPLRHWPLLAFSDASTSRNQARRP